MSFQKMQKTAFGAALLLLFALAPCVAQLAQTQSGKLQFSVRDAKGQPLPCRVLVYDAAGKPQRADKLPFWRDHFVCAGDAALDLPPGKYRYEIERGPEHDRVTGTADVRPDAPGFVKAQLKRIGNLAALGWHSGDLHVHRAPADIPLLMQAEDLHVAPVITWWNKQNPWAEKPLPEPALVRFDGNRFYHLLAGEDERGGGALLYFHLKKPLAIAGAAKEYPSSLKFALDAKLGPDEVWIDIEKPFWWDFALWLASGKMDSVGIANNHQNRSVMYESEAWGKPRDPLAYPAPLGNGFWSQDIYYHALNTGLRLPPSAGSASGVLPNPVGYNRVYVHTGKELTWDGWWKNLKAGRSFVTNGPLLLVTANGQMPGHVFRAPAGKTVEIDIKAEVLSNDPIKNVVIIQNGQRQRVLAVKRKEFHEGLGKITFKESGWFLVRAMADVPNTFRFASTAPFYVEIGPQKNRVDRRSVQFFLDWTTERMANLKQALVDPEQAREVLAEHAKARAYWEDLLKKAKD
ncbi:MAG: CehA/McbA family metallohydrolase [Gemmataceae bacterium]|nr:CehA/McbA family metallohydrolase [Gemmataceae bacterium]MCI0740640.1 CehA/McbA family metallohydrolase [Gemmataceae bacterium]